MRRKSGKRIAFKGATRFRDALLEPPPDPLQAEDRVPAAALRVVWIELERAEELPLRFWLVQLPEERCNGELSSRNTRRRFALGVAQILE
jgi:hypothetical protein